MPRRSSACWPSTRDCACATRSPPSSGRRPTGRPPPRSGRPSGSIRSGFSTAGPRRRRLDRDRPGQPRAASGRHPRRGHGPVRPPGGAPCPEDAEAALALYAGDLLEGLGHECFAAERERLSDLYEDLLAAVAEQRLDRGDLAGARWAATELLGRDPLREEAHAVLIALYGRTGSRSQIVRQYRRLCGILRSELSVTPAARDRRHLSRRAGPGDRAIARAGRGARLRRATAVRRSIESSSRAPEARPRVRRACRPAPGRRPADASNAACSSAVSSISKTRSMPAARRGRPARRRTGRRVPNSPWSRTAHGRTRFRSRRIASTISNVDAAGA